MVIKGLTDNGNTGFPILGKLRKGAKKTQEGRPGKDLPDYWRFTSETPGVTEAFEAVYGTEPNKLTVFLPYPKMSDNWDTAKELWSGGQVLQHRCDGEKCSQWLDENSGEYVAAERDGVEPIPCPGGCKEVGRLEVILPALVDAGFVGTVTAETHSINDIVAIERALRAGDMLLTQWGWRVSQVPWFLYRSTKTIGRPRTAKERANKSLKSVRGTTDKSLVFITPDAEWMSAQVKAVQEHARTGLPAPAIKKIEMNAQQARDEALPAPRTESGLLKDEDIVTVNPATGEILDDEPPPSKEPDPWDDDPDSGQDDIIPELSNKAEFWEWAQGRFASLPERELADACRSATAETGTFDSAAEKLMEKLA